MRSVVQRAVAEVIASAEQQAGEAMDSARRESERLIGRARTAKDAATDEQRVLLSRAKAMAWAEFEAEGRRRALALRDFCARVDELAARLGIGAGTSASRADPVVRAHRSLEAAPPFGSSEGTRAFPTEQPPARMPSPPNAGPSEPERGQGSAPGPAGVRGQSHQPTTLRRAAAKAFRGARNGALGLFFSSL